MCSKEIYHGFGDDMSGRMISKSSEPLESLEGGQKFFKDRQSNLLVVLASGAVETVK